jgi:hypothetical protein
LEQIKKLKPKELAPGITGYYAHGNSLTFILKQLGKMILNNLSSA